MDSLPTTAPEFWGRKAVEYDDLIRRVVPRYDEMIDRLVASLPADAERVLELGCGTGSLSLRLVTAFPRARFTFVDAAPEMLAVARARITVAAPAAAEHATYVEARFEDLPREPGGWDLVVASLSLHHVADPLPVYRTLGASCIAGGALRMADGMRAATEAHHDAQMEDWRAYWQRPGGLDASETESVLDHVTRHDHYFTLEQHFGWLGDAGFEACDCIWRAGLFGVVSANRSG